MTRRSASDRILPATRWVAALVIPFLVAAFAILYIVPEQTEQLFAWKLRPTMSAMMLGAAYAGGIYFFGGVLLSRQWHRVKIGLLPVASFAALLGIATILHWDRFNHAHVSFFAWFGLYLTTPFIVLAVWLRNRTEDSGEPDARDMVVPHWARVMFGAVGVINLLISLFLFVVPAAMIDVWPWALTPLTARVLSAMFALPAVVGLGMALESRWSAARLILQSQGFSIVLILAALARSGGELDWTRPGSWLFACGLAGLLVGIALFYMAMQLQSRHGTRQ